MKTREIIVGAKYELMEYFDAVLSYTRTHLKENNLLYSRDGISKQIDEIINVNNGIGIMYVLSKDDKDKNSTDDVNLELRSYYIHVK
jgi:hypothetical protein